MGTLHVCFADLPQYGKPTPPINVSPLATTSNQIETLCELSDAAVDAATAADSPSAMTQQADPNKDMPPCSLSPGANSAHSISPTPRYERNISFFHQLSRRFGLLRSSDDPVFNAAEDDSTDSCSSTTGALPPMQRSTGASTTSSLCAPNSFNSNISGKSGAHLHTSNGACLKDGHGSSSEHISCASSETSSTADIEESQEQQMCSPKADAATTTATTTATKLSPTKERRSSARASFSRLQRRSTSSLRRAFESFSLSTRSLSCSGATPTAANTPVNAQQAAQRSDNGNTPIKSALKYNSNVELNRKLQAGGGGGGVIGAWHTSYSASSLQLTSSAAGSSSSSSSSTSKSSSKGKTKPPPQRILRQPVSYTYLKGISGLPTQRVPRSAVCCQYARR
ncbi:serine-rich adhesin for platelets [Rhagoletis pomonella]|uniref:serine-rich adhesin for platelets n=1 Tax=Rhagoletis pomonella TaxID=28610 RepID=UPI00177AFC5A|nr:serine-rich adhesin for platelets [Rhagoletis pomonella]